MAPPFLLMPPSPQAVAGAGIVSGFDMTSEAAMAKLSYVLGQPGLSLDSRKQVYPRLWAQFPPGLGGMGTRVRAAEGPAQWVVCLGREGAGMRGLPVAGKHQL